MSARQPYFEIVHSPGKEQPWWVRLRAGNGRIILTSETYVRERSAYRAIELVPGFTAWHEGCGDASCKQCPTAALFGSRYYAVRRVTE